MTTKLTGHLTQLGSGSHICRAPTTEGPEHSYCLSSCVVLAGTGRISG